MAKRDLSTIDLGQQKLRLAEDVMVWPVRECGELVYRFEIPSQHRFFRVGYSEYVLISMLDGKTTLPEACGLAAARLGPDAPTAAQASTIARWLIEHQLACLENEANPSRSESFHASAHQSLQSGRARKTLLKGLNPFWLKVPFPKSGNWVPRIAEKLKPLCSIYVVSCSLLVCCIAAWQFAVNSELFLSTSVEVFHRSNWAYLLLTWVVLKLVHELAHAVVCAQTGSEVSEAGLVFVLFAPLAYVNVTSCWRLSDRWKRIAVASAGMYVELLIAAVAFLFWLNVSDIHTRFLLDNIVWMAGVSTLLFNLNVLMRFDGYYILADLVEVPNLYGEAMQAVKSVFLRLVVGQASEPSRLLGWRRTFVLAYGLAALVWRIFICVSLMIAASVMFSGAGVLLSLFGIYFWFAGPAQQFCNFLMTLWRSEPERAVRAIVLSGVGFGVVSIGLFVVPFPTAITVPGIVEYTPSTIVRSGVDGFIREIHVTQGEYVESGQLLMKIENDELLNRLEQMRIRAQQCEIKISLAVDEHDAANAYVNRQVRASLDEQIANLQRQVQCMQVTAPRSGTVIARDLRNLLGTFVEEGSQLLNVADDGSKEIIAMVGQREIDDVRALGRSEVKVCTAGWLTSSGFLERVEPQARDTLAWHALAATEGGPLTVREHHDDRDSRSLRLLEPLFQVRIRPAALRSSQLPAGIRVTASLGYRTETVSSRAAALLTNWWQDANAKVQTQ